MDTTGRGTSGTGPRVDRARDHRPHRRRRIVLLVAVASFAAWSFAGTSARTAHGAARCIPRASASIEDHLTGVACPPEGFAEAFGYEPQLVWTGYGWRYEKPASAGASCSGPLRDQGFAWNFGGPCATHDYGYDLLRYGFDDRDRIDALFYRDMLATCGTVPLPEQPVCRMFARYGKTGLDIGRSGVWPVEPSKAPTR